MDAQAADDLSIARALVRDEWIGIDPGAYELVFIANKGTNDQWIGRFKRGRDSLPWTPMPVEEPVDHGSWITETDDVPRVLDWINSAFMDPDPENSMARFVRAINAVAREKGLGDG